MPTQKRQGAGRAHSQARRAVQPPPQAVARCPRPSRPTSAAEPSREAAPPPPPPAPAPAPAPPRAGARAEPSEPEHQRSEGHEHSEAHPDRQGPERRRRNRDAQAGPDLPDSQGADRAERLHLLGRRAGGAAGRFWLPARAGLQLSARPGRHLRVAVADPEVRPAHRRYGVGPDTAAEGRRALFRADQGRGGQFRGARPGAGEAVLREPDAAVSAGGADPGIDARQPVRARDGLDDAGRQGAARADCRGAAHGQDDAAAEPRAVHRPRTIPRSSSSSCSSTSVRKRSPTCSAR